jgi:FkbH-like protein
MTATDPIALVQEGREHAAAGRWADAVPLVRQALAMRPSHTFYARAQRVIDDVALHAGPGVRQARIAVLGSSTTSLLIPILRALAFRDRIDAVFYEGAFGAFRQEALTPGGPLTAFAPSIVVVAPNWRDLELPPIGVDDPARTVERIVNEYRAVWTTLHARFGCHVVQLSFDRPADDSAGLLSQHVASGRRRLIRRINLALGDAVCPGVSLLDTEDVAGETGLDRWSNPRFWYLARQYPSAEAFPVLAEETMAHVRAVLGLSRKVLVCDLDNTLWKGVIGEDGIGGIVVGPGSPEGEAYADLQRYVRELRERGVVLAVCSKNDPADAEAPFREKTGMILRRDDFAVFLANWDDKATNLRRIAQTVGVGLDSLVMLDDNPFERGWLRSEVPDVAVPELGTSVFTYVRDLDRARLFPAIAWSPADERRADSYRLEREREEVRAASGNLGEYLASLSMRAACVAVDDSNIERVTQLTNKTNQFNVTTRRRTIAEVRQRATVGWTGVFSLQDRFGDYGIIGVLFAEPGDEPAAWTIDTWLMSCRVLRRDVEKFMLDCLIDAARAAGVLEIRGEYIATEKNGLVADLFPLLGFEIRSREGGRATYALSVDRMAGPLSTAIAREPSGVSLVRD